MRATALGLALSLLACPVALATPAAAQSAEQLDGARKLFTEALTDEGAKRYDTALEKFRRVAEVKDTANVHYRIASCLEALGRRAEALASYEATLKLGGEPAVMRDSQAHATELDRVVPRLSIVLPADAPAATEVRVDDAPVDRSALADKPLDVGHHTIHATAPGDTPFEMGVLLPEGAHMSITVTLTPVAPPPGPPVVGPPVGPPVGPTLGQGPQVPAGPPGDRKRPPVVPAHPSHLGAWIAIGVGGALAAGSVVSFVLRQSNIATINNDCPGGGSPLNCPPSKESEVNGALSAAQWQGPLAIGLAAGAVVGLGLGAWLLVASPSRYVSVAPAFLHDGGLLVVQGRM